MVAQGTAAMTAWTASSRLFFALARDQAFPYKRVFCAAYIGSVVAFNAILSAAAISVLLA
jgi:hypothetical protein